MRPIEIITQLLELIVALAAAPLFVGWISQCRAWLQNRSAPRLWLPYRGIRKLFHKDAVIAETASRLFRLTPYIVFAAMVVAAGIIPSMGTRLPLTQVADAIALVGLLSVASASYSEHRPFQMLIIRQVIWTAAGAAAMFAVVMFYYRALSSYSYPIYVAVMGLLVTVGLIGQATGGSRRWINLGLFTLEPSELARLVETAGKSAVGHLEEKFLQDLVGRIGVP